jgi:hypothetical protein
MVCLTTALTAPFMPGASPPEVMTAIFFFPFGMAAGVRLISAILRE